jgi:arsenate reductase-like glutaredoxin family protein
MLKIYGIKNCNSMKKAFDALQAKGLAMNFMIIKNKALMLIL